MESIRLTISLPQDDTYQKAQAKAAKQAGAELGVEIQILQADNDAVLQSQQLLELIQSKPERRPHAILSEPLTSTLKRAFMASSLISLSTCFSNLRAAS